MRDHNMLITNFIRIKYYSSTFKLLNFRFYSNMVKKKKNFLCTKPVNEKRDLEMLLYFHIGISNVWVFFFFFCPVNILYYLILMTARVILRYYCMGHVPVELMARTSGRKRLTRKKHATRAACDSASRHITTDGRRSCELAVPFKTPSPALTYSTAER